MRITTLCSLLAAAAGAVMLACGEVSFPVATPDEVFTATMTGDNEVPTPVVTTATGSAVFAVIDDTILTYNIAVADIDSTTLSHIHAGDAATPGPVIVNLFLGSTVNCKQNNDTAFTIVSSSVANPTVITLVGPHGQAAGSTFLVRITGHVGSTPAIDGEYTATRTGTTSFSIPVNVTAGGTGGKSQRWSLINTTSPRCRQDFTGNIAQTQIRPSALTLPSIQGYGATPRERFDSLLALMRTGLVYVNVHTRANGAGEIRGQINPQ
jgi:hypothetical protein